MDGWAMKKDKNWEEKQNKRKNEEEEEPEPESGKKKLVKLIAKLLNDDSGGE